MPDPIVHAGTEGLAGESAGLRAAVASDAAGTGRGMTPTALWAQEVMRERFEAFIEHATGRRVIGFMSGNQQAPDVICELFGLAPSDLVDDHELPDRVS